MGHDTRSGFITPFRREPEDLWSEARKEAGASRESVAGGHVERRNGRLTPPQPTETGRSGNEVMNRF